MYKKKLLGLCACFTLLLSGCSALSPTVETMAPTTETTVADTTTEAIPETTTTTTTTQKAETTAAETTTEVEYIPIEITTEAPTSGSGRMEATDQLYEKNKIKVHYPVLVGMSDSEAQDWANEEIYNDMLALLRYYNVDTANDTLELDYNVSTIYRGEFSFVYDGTLTQAKTGYTINIKAAEDFDLSTKERIKLSGRLSSAKFIKSILEDADYEIVSTSVSEDTLKTYLSQQSEDFYKELLEKADFGSKDELNGAFSYNNLGNVAIVIPMPHMMGDYAVISIKQKTK